MLKLITFSLFLTLSACAPEHGTLNDPIASAEAPFQSSDLDLLTKLLKSFSKNNELNFQKESSEDEFRYSLVNDDIRMLVIVRDQRLKVAATGPVTQTSIELANRYIEEIIAVGSLPDS